MTTRQIILNIPETLLQSEAMDDVTFGRELRILAAVKLYELGRLSSGQAAELADMPRVEFLLTLKKYKVFPLKSELLDLEENLA
jgi:predicted HTH domain antitoxin